MTEDAARKRSWPLLLAAAFLVLFLGVYVWRVRQRLLDIEADKRTEKCRSALTRLWSAERSHFGEYDEYARDFAELGFVPGEMTSALVVHPEDAWGRAGVGPGGSDLTGEQVAEAIVVARARGSEVGVTGTCPTCGLTALCITQLDLDDTLDIWSISTESRRLGGVKIPEGVPHHDVDDLRE